MAGTVAEGSEGKTGSGQPDLEALQLCRNLDLFLDSKLEAWNEAESGTERLHSVTLCLLLCTS